MSRSWRAVCVDRKVSNAALPDDDFDVRIAQAESDQHHLDAVVGSWRGASS